MLKYLRIQNFAIIENVEIEFGTGLNIISGETGAGKSIIMDALNIILGGRAKSDLIRSGTNSASVEALFEVPDREAIQGVLDNTGIEIEYDELIVRRIIQPNGKSRAFINDVMVNVGTLNLITERLVDLCSQGDQRLLQRNDEQLIWLDRFADIESVRSFVKERFQAWKQKIGELKALEDDSSDRERRVDFLNFQLKELDEAKLESETEDSSIKSEFDILSNSETLLNFAREAESAINGCDDGNKAMLDTLGSLVNRAEELVKTDSNLTPAYELMNSLKVTLEEAGYFFRDYMNNIEVDDSRLEDLNHRYNLLTQIKRKYGPSLKEVIESRDIFRNEVESYENHDENLQIAKAAVNEARSSFDDEADTLSEKRQVAAGAFAAAVEAELAELNMERAKFECKIDRTEEPTSAGVDRADYLLAANPGEEAAPLHKVASGGELSRIMLALHNVLSNRGGVRVYLFDEVDTGVGGKTAAVVGKKLQKVASNSQVICITHLPQVASFADRHLRVEKSVTEVNGEERTTSNVVPVEGDDQILEVARMLGGMEDSSEALANAESMIVSAKNLKTDDSASIDALTTNE